MGADDDQGYPHDIAVSGRLLLNRGGARAKSTVQDVYGQPSAVAGIDAAFQQKHIVKLLLVHGMGPHSPSETRPFTDDVAARLGFAAKVPHDTPGVLKPPALPPGAEPAMLRLRTYTRQNEAAPGQVDVPIAYEVTWSPLIDNIKHEALKEDAEHVRSCSYQSAPETQSNERPTDRPCDVSR